MSSKVGQLETLIRRYPNDRVDICGVILDYLGETNKSLVDIFDMNTALYRALFRDENLHQTEALVRNLSVDRAQRERLRSGCVTIFPMVSELLKKIEDQESKLDGLTPGNAHAIFKPEDFADAKPFPLIWQISDVHFGRFNLLENNPRELAAVLCILNSRFPEWAPDIIVVSGDLTSVADQSEFEKFIEFARALSQNIWGELRPQRFLVIPGNHDTSWLEDGTTDRLKLFQDILNSQDVFLTPFGAQYQAYEGDNIIVKRWTSAGPTVPPLMTVEYKAYDLEILLIISSYYSGQIPESVRKQVAAAHFDQAELLSLLRQDTGELTREYILMVENLPKATRTRIAFTHHHLCTYGSMPCITKHAPFALQTLYRKGCHVVFHGHVHLIEDSSPIRCTVPETAFPIPCPTLTSHSVAGGNGIAVHTFGQPGPGRSMATFIWQLTTNGAFEANTCELRYQGDISAGTIKLKSR